MSTNKVRVTRSKHEIIFRTSNNSRNSPSGITLEYLGNNTDDYREAPAFNAITTHAMWFVCMGMGLQGPTVFMDTRTGEERFLDVVDGISIAVSSMLANNPVTIPDDLSSYKVMSVGKSSSLLAGKGHTKVVLNKDIQ